MNYTLITPIVAGLVLAIAIFATSFVLHRFLKTPFDTKKTIKDIIDAGTDDGGDMRPATDEAGVKKTDNKAKMWIDTQETLRLVVRERAIRQISLATLCAASLLGATVFAVVLVLRPEKSAKAITSTAPPIGVMTINVFTSADTNSPTLTMSTNVTSQATNAPKP